MAAESRGAARLHAIVLAVRLARRAATHAWGRRAAAFRSGISQIIEETRTPSRRFLFVTVAMGVIGFGFAILIALS